MLRAPTQLLSIWPNPAEFGRPPRLELPARAEFEVPQTQPGPVISARVWKSPPDFGNLRPTSARLWKSPPDFRPTSGGSRAEILCRYLR